MAEAEDPRGAGRLSRRRALQLGGGALAAGALGAGTVAAAGAVAGDRPQRAPQLPFDGDGPQQGIVSPPPRQLVLAAFDLAPEVRGRFGRGELAGVLRDWSTAARRLAAGRALEQPLGSDAVLLGAPADGGAVAGLAPSGLTLTIGLGPGVFAAERELVAARLAPRELRALPHFAGDRLQERWSGGDLLVQAAADDVQAAVHAVHELQRIARGVAGLRWLQRGFLPQVAEGEVPRNLMGFHDGIELLDHRDRGTAARLLWAGGDEPAWLRGGGTYLVLRRIRIDLGEWHKHVVADQEEIIGRRKASGELAPAATADPYGAPVLAPAGEAQGSPRRSHVLLARASVAAGQQFLRRPYSYADGADAETGELDAGLLFLAFQRSPARQFVPTQRLLAESDAMSAYVTPVGSAVFALPPASRGERDWVGRTLLG